jgi:ElaB/YqjD/DUF883 family membrane-anchored ribosome-binding protein
LVSRNKEDNTMATNQRGNNRSDSYTDVAAELSAAKDSASSLVSEVRHKAQEGIDVTVDQAKKVAGQFQEGHHKICEYTSNHPTTALLIALGVGAITGRLLSRWL